MAIRGARWLVVVALAFAFAPSGARAQDATAPDAGAPTEELPPSSGEIAPTAPPPAAPTVPEPPAAPPAAPSPYQGNDVRRYPTGMGAGDDALESAETRRLRIPSRIATRLRVLDRDFTALGSRGGGSIVDGVLAIVSGGLSITLGIIVADGSQNLSTFLYIMGGAAVARGVIDIALTPDLTDASITFGHMPMGSVREVRERLRYGERELESLADQTRLARLLDAGISIGAGVGFATVYFVQNDFEVVEPLDWFLLIGAGISVISGVINLVSRSEAERRWDAYSTLKSRLQRERRGERRDTGPTARLGGGPIPGGGGLVLSGSF